MGRGAGGPCDSVTTGFDVNRIDCPSGPSKLATVIPVVVITPFSSTTTSVREGTVADTVTVDVVTDRRVQVSSVEAILNCGSTGATVEARGQLWKHGATVVARGEYDLL